jgi:hypothetical protein
MRRKTDVTFAANPEIYYQDFFPIWDATLQILHSSISVQIE